MPDNDIPSKDKRCPGTIGRPDCRMRPTRTYKDKQGRYICVHCARDLGYDIPFGRARNKTISKAAPAKDKGNIKELFIPIDYNLEEAFRAKLENIDPALDNKDYTTLATKECIAEWLGANPKTRLPIGEAGAASILGISRTQFGKLKNDKIVVEMQRAFLLGVAQSPAVLRIILPVLVTNISENDRKAIEIYHRYYLPSVKENSDADDQTFAPISNEMKKASGKEMGKADLLDLAMDF